MNVIKKGSDKSRTTLYMTKTILKFLIALIAPSTLTVIYIFSEAHIVKLLSSDSTGELSKTLLRSGLGVSSTIIFALSLWVSELKDKIKNINTTDKPENATIVAANKTIEEMNLHAASCVVS